MAKKELTKKQAAFKSEVKEQLEYLNDELRVRFHFSGDDVHVDVIEDECSHFHIRGEIADDYFNVFSMSSNTTMDTTRDLVDLFFDLSF